MKTVLLGLALLLVPTASSAQENAPAPAPAPKVEKIRIRAGARFTFVNDAGLDTFGDSDELSQLSLEGDYLLWKRGALGVSVGGAYDVGPKRAGARGIDTLLQVHRLSVPIEGRWTFTPWLYSFARVAPGTAAMVARVEDPSSPHELQGTKWVFTTDLSAGGAIRFAPHVWVTPEIGYAWSAKGDLHADPNRNESDVLGRDVQTKLGSLALSGAFFRVSAAVSF